VEQVLLEVGCPFHHVVVTGLDEEVGGTKLATLRSKQELSSEEAIGALPGLQEHGPVLTVVGDRAYLEFLGRLVEQLKLRIDPTGLIVPE
jgi:hypothetical protein